MKVYQFRAKVVVSAAAMLLVAVPLGSNVAAVEYGDRWNYDETITRSDGWVDYGPTEWDEIKCDESDVEGLDACLAYTDKWHEGIDWEIKKNYCRHCPFDRRGSCGRHHMSPINLERNRGLGFWGTTDVNNGDPGQGAHELAKECIDSHWMKYEDSWCPLDQLVEANAFTIERHGLRISQPIRVNDLDEVRISCFIEGKGSRFGRIDYSKGFSQWWFLSHIDIHTPSEHTQEEKRYDAEIQLHHFYSVGPDISNTNNELGTVAMFMEAYDDAPPYRYLDKVICQWRRTEFETRQACGLPPVEGTYPGCFNYQRKTRNMRSNDQSDSTSPIKKKKEEFKNVFHLFMAHDRKERDPRKYNRTLPTLKLDEENWGAPERTEEEWAELIEQESQRHQADEELWKQLHHEFDGDSEKAHHEYHARHRQLLMGDEIEWFNYWPMLGVRTEYYYRYSGSMTTPPCYGNHDGSTRSGTLHWRVMKDPIRIHPRQLAELKRLIAERIQPSDEPVMACQPDTAAKIEGDEVNTARPLQYFDDVHYKVFCECKDWPSKWPEDRAWCDINDIYERFYDQPYNFLTAGF